MLSGLLFLTCVLLYLRAAGATVDDKVEVSVVIELDGARHTLDGRGNGPIEAFVNALSGVDLDVRVLDYAEHALTAGENAQAAAYVECSVGGQTYWGVGVDPNILTASLRAVVSAVNRTA